MVKPGTPATPFNKSNNNTLTLTKMITRDFKTLEGIGWNAEISSVIIRKGNFRVQYGECEDGLITVDVQSRDKFYTAKEIANMVRGEVAKGLGWWGEFSSVRLTEAQFKELLKLLDALN